MVVSAAVSVVVSVVVIVIVEVIVVVVVVIHVSIGKWKCRRLVDAAAEATSALVVGVVVVAARLCFVADVNMKFVVVVRQEWKSCLYFGLLGSDSKILVLQEVAGSFFAPCRFAVAEASARG